MKEKKMITRREALGRLFATTGMMAVSPSLMSFYGQLTGLSGNTALTPDNFFINRIREALNGVDAFPVPPTETGKRHYEVYSLLFANQPLWKGSILLHHRGDRLTVEVRRFGASPDKYSQYTFIEQKVRKDALLSPESWRYTSYLAQTTDGVPYGAPLEGQGTYDGNDSIVITEGTAQHHYHTPLLTTMNWNLLLAVDGIAKGRLPLNLGIIDEYDLFTGEKSFQPYETGTVTFDGTTIKLRSVVMTGQSILPTFYWIDDTGTPLFVNSGTEVYILHQKEAPNPKSVNNRKVRKEGAEFANINDLLS